MGSTDVFVHEPLFQRLMVHMQMALEDGLLCTLEGQEERSWRAETAVGGGAAGRIGENRKENCYGTLWTAECRENESLPGYDRPNVSFNLLEGKP